MLGWEFPPFISGGLGTACYGLTKAMSGLGVHISFVLPKPINTKNLATHVKMKSPADIKIKKYTELIDKETILKNVEFKTIESPLKPYENPETYQIEIEKLIRKKQTHLNEHFIEKAQLKNQKQCDYSGDMYSETQRYARAAVKLAQNEKFDVIHAHDWMTYQAGIAVAADTEKPLVIHVHSTEFDRSGEHVNQKIYDIERAGMMAADKIIAVSYLTKNIIVSRYAVNANKVEVVYNGVEKNENELSKQRIGIKTNEKIVLFLGRITMQKGPEYFLDAAKKVLDIMDNVKFVMAGAGDMMKTIIEKAAEMGIGNKVLFTGFLRGEDVRKIYEIADLYVMPSVSEPFGIAPLEALNNDVPVLISKQSGVAEVLTHVLKTDFWDTKEIANKIVAVLKYSSLRTTLKEHGNFEVRKLRWEDAAEKCCKIYDDVLYETVCV